MTFAFAGGCYEAQVMYTRTSCSDYFVCINVSTLDSYQNARFYHATNRVADKIWTRRNVRTVTKWC